MRNLRTFEITATGVNVGARIAEELGPGEEIVTLAASQFTVDRTGNSYAHRWVVIVANDSP